MPSSGPFNFRLPSSANFVPKQLIDPSLSFFYHKNKFGGRGYSGLFLPEVAIYRISQYVSSCVCIMRLKCIGYVKKIWKYTYVWICNNLLGIHFSFRRYLQEVLFDNQASSCLTGDGGSNKQIKQIKFKHDKNCTVSVEKLSCW